MGVHVGRPSTPHLIAPHIHLISGEIGGGSYSWIIIDDFVVISRSVLECSPSPSIRLDSNVDYAVLPVWQDEDSEEEETDDTDTTPCMEPEMEPEGQPIAAGSSEQEWWD